MEISEEDKHLLESFKALNIKPKADTPHDLQQWLQDFSKTNTSASSTSISVTSFRPKLSTFYGDVFRLTKGEVLYDQSKYEVHCLLSEKYKEEEIQQAIRRSVKGDAAGVLQRLKGKPLADILKKFESVFGKTDNKAAVLKKFYSAEQGKDEDIQHWSCRLEALLSDAIELDLAKEEHANDMLCDMFWNGMKTELKDITGYKYDQVKDFDQLRIAVKQIEHDHLKSKEMPVSKSATTDIGVRKEIDDLKKMVSSLTDTVKDLSKQIQSPNNTQPRREQHRQRQGRHYNSQQQRENIPRPQRNPQYQGTQHTQPRRYFNNASTRNDGDGPTCFRCLQRGHMQWQCRTRMDHSHLN